MTRCRVCVMPPTRPDTPFVDGVCSACANYSQRKSVDWDARKQELLKLLERFDGKCIVPSSGGKDSHYQALMLKSLGADVTCVTATTCHLTPMGRANIDNLARHVRTIEVTPNMTERARLNRIGLELVGDISWPEHVSIFTTPFRMAKALGINLLFYGECPQNQYGGPEGTENVRQMTARWRSEFGGFLGLRPSDIGASSDYELPENLTGIEAHFLGYYMPWDSHRNAEISIEHGMKSSLPTPANWWHWENLDNAQTGIHDWMMFRKYGYGRGCAQISVDVRYGLVQRAAAEAWVREHDGLYPEVYAGVPIGQVLCRIGMTEPELKAIADRFSGCSLAA